MPRGFHGETRSERWPVHVAGIERMRIAPGVEAALRAAKPALLDEKDFLHDVSLLGSLTVLLYTGRWAELIGQLCQLTGAERTNVPAAPTAAAVGTSVPNQDRRPSERSLSISDGEARRLLGATKLPR